MTVTPTRVRAGRATWSSTGLRLLVGAGLLAAFLVLRIVAPPDVALADTARDLVTLSIAGTSSSRGLKWFEVLVGTEQRGDRDDAVDATAGD